MSSLGLLQLGLLAPLSFAVVSAVLIAAFYPFIRRALARSEPVRRTLVIGALCALPALAAVGLTALCFLPSILGNVWPGLDHCPQHGDGHPHFCWMHVPASSGSHLGWLVVVSVSIFLFARLTRHLARLVRSRRLLRQLARSAVFDRVRRVWRVETNVPLAVTTGVLQQRTFISRGLCDSLAPRLVEAAIVHEHVHQKRRDPLVKLMASTLSLLHFPSTRRQMLTDLELATEQACDEETATRLGDRLRVAQALLGLERLLQQTGQQPIGEVGVSFGGSSVVPRVESLLADPVIAATRSRVWRWLVSALLAAVLLALAEPIHHLTETLLGLLVR